MLLLVGAGLMAREYARVLRAMGHEFEVVGRGPEKVEEFTSVVGIQAISGGLKSYLESRPSPPKRAIVAVGIEQLATCTACLSSHGVTEILVEKPGIGPPEEINLLQPAGSGHVLLAYNRRFYASTLKAQELIAEDGGVESFFFEFTEWNHQIRTLVKERCELNYWFLGNSSHLIDLAFFLGGPPQEMDCRFKGGLDWHPASRIFVGSGITHQDALFSYHANWSGPGRWGLEIVTPKRRLIFRPVEKLQELAIGSVTPQPVELEDHLDETYKPGLYRQTEAFLQGDWSRFLTAQQQAERLPLYCRMAGY